MKQQAFTVSGMSCVACSARVEKVVSTLSGVSEVQVNLLTGSMNVRYEESITDSAQIISAVENAGYSASVAAGSTTTTTGESSIPHRLIFSGCFLLPLVLLHHLWHNPYSIFFQLLLLIPIVWLNRKFFISGTAAALHKAPNMDTLIALGAAAGILYTLCDFLLLHSGASYLESSGMILTLITLGKWLESRATGHTGDALNKLKSHLPQTATIQKGELQQTIPADEVQTGDSIIIAPGARVPVDARVFDGTSAIDESTITGESIPQYKQAGATIYAGTVNGNGLLRATALNTCGNSSLSHIIHLLGEASAAKAPMARVADRIAGFFVPIVVVIAILTGVIWFIISASLPFSIGFAVAVLVISCPCALGLATPVAIMAGAGKGAENGILFRDGATMENARKADVVILDKTGTLTAGHPIVSDITPAERVTKSELLQLAASLEQNSNHPLAQAICKAAADYTPETARGLQYHAGRGVSAEIGGAICKAGNAAYMRENGITIDESVPGGMTPVYFAKGSTYVGKIVLSDPLKPDSKTAVAAMKEHGLRVLIMSGDREEAVTHVAGQVGITEYRAGVLPQEKEQMVRQLRGEGHCVAMIGDGINDAPALMRADVGIAIGAGTDLAIDSAGIILVRSELSDAVSAITLSKAVIRTIRQNLFWAFFYNALAIPLAAGLYYPLLGWQLSPGIAAAAMSLSSLFVVCNALRLRNLKLQHTTKPSMNNVTISVEGMMCPHCERHVTQALSALPGITEVTADHKTASVRIVSSAPVDEAQIAATVKNAGYNYQGIC